MIRLCGLTDLVDCFRAAMQWLFNHTIGYLTLKIQEAIIHLLSIACQKMLEEVATVWVDFTTPDVGSNPAVTFMRGQLGGIQYYLATVAVIVAGIHMAWTHRGDRANDLVKSLLTFAIGSALGVALMSLLISASDEYSKWIVRQSLRGDSLATTMDAFVRFEDGKNPGSGLFAFTLICLIAITCIAVAFIQLIMLVIRAAGLIVVAATFPLAVAATYTELGQQWFKRAVSLMVMFVAYKPAAATVYAAAIVMVGKAPKGASASELVVNAITGVTLMVLAVIMMPALMRLAAPHSTR